LSIADFIFAAVLLVIVAAIVVVGVAVRSLRVGRAPRHWWLIWWIHLFTGIGLGIYFTSFEYASGATWRVVGFPVPIVIFELKGGRWVDFPNGLGPLVFGINGVAFTSILLIPFSILALIQFGGWPTAAVRTKGFPVR